LRSGRLAFRIGLLGFRLLGLRFGVELSLIGLGARIRVRELLLAVALLAVAARLAFGRLRLAALLRLPLLVAGGFAAVRLLRRLARVAVALLRVLLLLVVAGLLLLRRRGRILLEQLLEQIAVVACVLVIRIELERTVVGRDRAFDIAGPSERRAAVVVDRK